MKRLLVAVAAAAALASGCAQREFRLSGTITVAASLQRRAPQDNVVLFIVAKNRGDVPVAVQRMVNPQFPVEFSLGPEDLIVPDLPADTPLRVEVEMNAHGAMGKPQHGDMGGTHPNLVYPGERRVHLVIDRQF